jgi:hypothetical protein
MREDIGHSYAQICKPSQAKSAHVDLLVRNAWLFPSTEAHGTLIRERSFNLVAHRVGLESDHCIGLTSHACFLFGKPFVLPQSRAE